jgi:SAM-dependent methyltransferase
VPTTEPGYGAQTRGGIDDYRRYLAGMDSSMRQKVALTAAHLLCEGKIADMGMGSGQGSHALAALYPRLEVVGVDIDATMVALAREQYRLPNLSFVAGDIAGPVFPPESLDGIFDSSVLHHVTSFGAYRHQNAADALAAQVAELRPHGVLVVRDFVDPGPAPVLLDVPADDGDDSDDPRRCSTAALLVRFSREFRALAPEPGFSLAADGDAAGAGAPVAPPRPGWRRFQLQHKHAAEFVLRKDYRADWDSEVKEEYTYFTQAEFEATLARLGLRVLASTPLRNPWIVRHRFRDRFLLHDLAGRALDVPATNYVIVGEKVPPGEGVAFRAGPVLPPRGFLTMEHHRHRETGQVFDLAARPHPTVDILPFFEHRGLLYVLARTSYPRPILRPILGGHPSLDGARPPGYVAEPLNVLQTDRPLGQTVEAALARAAGIAPRQIRRLLPGTTYYPSPGGILEEVRSVLVEIEPMFANAPAAGLSGFSTSGRVRAIEACQLLRAAQVGGLPDARLELNVHELLLRLGRSAGPWIGEGIRIGDGAAAGITTAVAAAAGALPGGPGRRAFEPTTEPAGFLRVLAASFEELDAGGRVIGAQPLEYVAPVPLGTNTVAAALIARAAGGALLLGLDRDDLPAAQAFSGNSDLLVTPAWRLPHDVVTVAAARTFVATRLAEEYGLAVGETWELGGPYRPSPGLTPETVFPLCVEVTGAADPAAGRRPILWMPLEVAITHRAALPDGHLRVASLRAAHALGALPGESPVGAEG